jgi:hypothetical protein
VLISCSCFDSQFAGGMLRGTSGVSRRARTSGQRLSNTPSTDAAYGSRSSMGLSFFTGMIAPPPRTASPRNPRRR